MGDTVSVERLTTAEQFRMLEPAWDALALQNSVSSPQLTFSWLFTWWRWFGSDTSLYILTARRGEQCVGIAPLFLRQDQAQEGGRVVHFLGEGLSDYAGFLCMENDNDASRGLWRYLLDHEQDWDSIFLREIPEGAPDNAAALSLCSGTRFHAQSDRTVGCPFLPVTCDAATYEKELSRNMRKNLRKAHDHAADTGLSLCFDTISAAPPSLLDEMEAIAQQRNSADAHRSPFLDGRGRGFVRDALPLLASHDHLRIFTARHGDRLVSYIICFSYRETLYDWISSYDPEYREFSVTTLLREQLFRYVHQSGYRVFDFMRGEEFYKFEWVSNMHWNTALSITKEPAEASV